MSRLQDKATKNYSYINLYLMFASITFLLDGNNENICKIVCICRLTFHKEKKLYGKDRNLGIIFNSFPQNCNQCLNYLTSFIIVGEK